MRSISLLLAAMLALAPVVSHAAEADPMDARDAAAMSTKGDDEEYPWGLFGLLGLLGLLRRRGGDHRR